MLYMLYKLNVFIRTHKSVFDFDVVENENKSAEMKPL